MARFLAADVVRLNDPVGVIQALVFSHTIQYNIVGCFLLGQIVAHFGVRTGGFIGA